MAASNLSGSRLRFGMDLIATLAAVAGCAIVIWLNWTRIFPPTPRLPGMPVSLEGATLKGQASAPVVLIEYSDYKCPWCGKAEREVLPEITRQYIETGRVQLAFRHHPIEQLHAGATRAAEAALCAGREGKFWEMHAALFSDQKNMDEASLFARGRTLALDEEKLRSCLAGEVAAQVQADIKEAETFGLTGTPGFLVGRRRPDGGVRVTAVLHGAQPAGNFQKVLDEALAERHESVTTTLVLPAGGSAALAAAAWLGLKRRQRRSTGN